MCLAPVWEAISIRNILPFFFSLQHTTTTFYSPFLYFGAASSSLFSLTPSPSFTTLVHRSTILVCGNQACSLPIRVNKLAAVAYNMKPNSPLRPMQPDHDRQPLSLRTERVPRSLSRRGVWTPRGKRHLIRDHARYIPPRLKLTKGSPLPPEDTRAEASSMELHEHGVPLNEKRP